MVTLAPAQAEPEISNTVPSTVPKTACAINKHRHSSRSTTKMSPPDQARVTIEVPVMRFLVYHEIVPDVTARPGSPSSNLIDNIAMMAREVITGHLIGQDRKG